MAQGLQRRGGSACPGDRSTPNGTSYATRIIPGTTVTGSTRGSQPGPDRPRRTAGAGGAERSGVERDDRDAVLREPGRAAVVRGQHDDPVGQDRDRVLPVRGA